MNEDGHSSVNPRIRISRKSNCQSCLLILFLWCSGCCIFPSFPIFYEDVHTEGTGELYQTPEGSIISPMYGHRGAEFRVREYDSYQVRVFGNLANKRHRPHAFSREFEQNGAYLIGSQAWRSNVKYQYESAEGLICRSPIEWIDDYVINYKIEGDTVLITGTSYPDTSLYTIRRAYRVVDEEAVILENRFKRRISILDQLGRYWD